MNNYVSPKYIIAQNKPGTGVWNQKVICECLVNLLIMAPIMAPKGGHIVISVSVRPSVLPSVRHRLFLLTGSSLCSLLLRNYSTDSSNDDANQLREQCRCATCTAF